MVLNNNFKIKILILLMIFNYNCFSQSTFCQKLFSMPSSGEWAYGLTQQPDSTFLTTGYIINGADKDISTAKLDKHGNLLWSKSVGQNCGYCNDEGYNVVNCYGGGFLVSGMYYGGSRPNAYAIKYDNSGNHIWYKSYDYGISNLFKSTIRTTDYGYIHVGNYIFSGKNHTTLLKTDSAGIIQWAKTYTGLATLGIGGKSIIQTSDGGYALVGASDSWGSGSSDMYFLKLNSLGVMQFAKTIGGTNLDRGWDVIQTVNGDFVICGDTYSFGISDIYVVKISSTGSLLWAHTIGYSGTNNELAQSIIEFSNNSYIITGSSESILGTNQAFICKLDLNGYLIWYKTIASNIVSNCCKIIKTLDNKIAVAGFYKDPIYNDQFLISKLDSNGNSCCFVTPLTMPNINYNGVLTSASTVTLANSPTPFTSISSGNLISAMPLCSGVITQNNYLSNESDKITVFPNPSNGEIIIKSNNLNSKINITDQFGQIIKSFNLNSDNNFEYKISDLLNGMYYLQDYEFKKNIKKIVILN